jgi:molecular chaperone GrpE
MDDSPPINQENDGATAPAANSPQRQLLFPICAQDKQPAITSVEPTVLSVQPAIMSVQPVSAEDQELVDWKQALRAQFEVWLEELDQIPESEAEPEAIDSPDLYSFYEQWAAANTEARRGNRRVAEAFSQWGETLARFESDLRPLREQLQRLPATAPTDALSRTHCLTLIELLDRLQRVERAFASSPAGSWWKGVAQWRRAWESQRQAIGILLNHFEALLKKEGVTPIQSLGQPFNPTLMSAVAVEPDGSRPHQTVLEEMAPGYLRGGELLRPAQVKVSTKKTSATSEAAPRANEKS